MILQRWLLGVLNLFLLVPVRASSPTGYGDDIVSNSLEEQTPILGGSLAPKPGGRSLGVSLEERLKQSCEITIAECELSGRSALASSQAIPYQRDFSCEDRLARTVLCLEIFGFLAWLSFIGILGIYNFITGGQ